MKLDLLMKLADEQGKGGCRRVYNSGHDVLLTLSTKGNNQPRIALTVYREPKKLHFGSLEYWQPVFVEEKKRVYLMYGNEDKGYKVIKNSKSAIGRVQYRNLDLEGYLQRSGDKRRVGNWILDTECGWPFILME